MKFSIRALNQIRGTSKTSGGEKLQDFDRMETTDTKHVSAPRKLSGKFF